MVRGDRLQYDVASHEPDRSYVDGHMSFALLELAHRA
jgi:hypothetical protein